MTQAQTIKIDRKSYVLLPRQEYQELLAMAHGVKLPGYPPAANDGNRPALEFARISLARKLIVRRLAAGWTQEQLARKAKVRVETISRLESAKHNPQAATIELIETAFEKAGV